MITFNDQESFLQIVRPPTGYKLHYCFGATFSLDLECVVALAQAAVKHGDPDRADGQNVQTALQGIVDFSEKSLILFHACQIKAMEKNIVALKAQDYRRLITLLDNVVFPVSSPQPECSFHPKVWLLRFDKEEGKGDEKFRLLVTSRNLSKQMDWEIGCALDGCRAKTADNISLDLRKFLQANEPAVPEAKKSLYREILNDLKFVGFNKPPRTKSVHFLFKNSEKRNGLGINPKDYESLIIISPFLSKETVKEFLEGVHDKNRIYIVTGMAHVFKLREIPQIHAHAYVFNPGEVNVEDSSGRIDIEMGLHAKIYVGLRRDGKGTDVFLGSANCTFSGLKGPNTEAMMLLQSPQSVFREFLGNFVFQKIKDEFPHNWLTKYLDLKPGELASAEEKAKLEKRLSDARAALATGKFKLHVKARSKEAILYFSGPKSFHLPEGVRVSVSPWGCLAWRPLVACAKHEGALFHSENCFQSDFVHVKLSCEGETKEFMSVARSNIDKSSRKKAIMRTYLQNPEAFFRYLMLILKMPRHIGAPGSGGKRRGIIGKKRRSLVGSDGKFLEEVLINASHNDSVIQQIQEALIAVKHRNKDFKEFIKFWCEFREAYAEIKRNG